MRAVAYLRVSTSRQEAHGAGLEVQREHVERFAREQGIELVDVREEAASGAVQKGDLFAWESRPVLLGILEEAKRPDRGFEAVLVSTRDRIARDPADQAICTRLLANGKSGGVDLLAACETNDDSDEAELMRDQLAGFAKYERKLIRRRLEAGRAMKHRQGRHVRGQTPYAYVQSGGGILEPVAELRPVVERIFADAGAGTSPARIARALNVEGVRGPKPKRTADAPAWTRQAVWAIVTNPVYKGEHSGVRGAQPAIVTARAWNAAQAALAKHRRKTD